MNGKQRASRIPLDYFERPDRMVKVKRFLAWLLLAGAIAWLVSLFFSSARGNLGPKRYSHGPVTAVHAPFEQDCAACHVNFGVFADHHSPDQKCQECHLQGDLATHSAVQKEGMTPNCGNCHSDHHGRDFTLRRVAEAQCTECHKDLGTAMTAPGKGYAYTVTSFAGDHPAF